jgi:hypothetical protein
MLITDTMLRFAMLGRRPQCFVLALLFAIKSYLRGEVFNLIYNKISLKFAHLISTIAYSKYLIEQRTELSSIK